jgi:Spy/CpxP family protein refolding chaperone
MRSIIRSAHLTDAQKAQITTVVEAQRADIAAAIASHDRMALREALRPVLLEIRHTLTPEQRQAVRAAVLNHLQDRYTVR